MKPIPRLIEWKDDEEYMWYTPTNSIDEIKITCLSLRNLLLDYTKPHPKTHKSTIFLIGDEHEK